MRRRCFLPLLALTAAAAAAAADQPALPFVNPIFGDNMVLQRDKPIRFWGWSKPGALVHVEVGSRTADAVTAPDGRWQTELTPVPSGGPFTVKTSSPAQTVSLTNVLIGDVWLCGGQSNMELPLARTRDGAEAIKAADQPRIRLFTVKSQPAYSPAATVSGSWKVCSPQTVSEDGGFSAVGYYFALKLQSETNVPLGLIKDCIGGTPAEAWTSADALRRFSDFDPALSEVARLRAKGGPVYGNYVMPWYDEFDVGQLGQGWAAPALDESDWKTVILPEGFRELGLPDTPALAYFCKTVDLPEPLPAGKAAIHLGVIERMDTTWINGRWVGASAWVENPRVYSVPEGVLKPGRNLVTVRVLKTKPQGGFQSKPEQLKLVLGDKTEVPLTGEWKARLSVDARPPHPLPLGYENWPVMPCVLYNGMLAPLAPLALRGAIWYQGEANFQRAHQYKSLLPAMIQDWRALFYQGAFPFYIVSLPAFMHHQAQPGNDSWAELREAQAITARTVPNCALAVTVDTGDPDNIHPIDKRVVGERLALCALANEYTGKQPFEGPAFSSLEHVPGGLKLNFNHADGGLVIKGEKPAEFAIAGKDRRWFWAEARVENSSIVVSSPKVPEPEAARYAWQANPVANVFNQAGLPAVPFRTDDWPDITEHAKPW